MRYIKTNSNNEIIDIFHDYQIQKFDETEIELDSNSGYMINGKYISNEYGIYLFIYDGSITEKTESEIDSDSDAVARLKQYYLSLIPDKAVMSFLNGIHTWAELQTAWQNFKNNSSSWTTITEVNTAWDNAVNYLTG